MKYNLMPDWYRDAYTLNMVHESWTYSTVQDVDFLCQILSLQPGTRILDIACGFGRHALELAARGMQVTAIDISTELIDLGRSRADEMNLAIEWICADVKSIVFPNQFDLVLNLYDGAIGYGMTENDNYALFKKIAECVRVGGYHLMHVPNLEYINRHVPQKRWCKADGQIELLELEWDDQHRYFFQTNYTIATGQVFDGLHPVREGKRVYSLDEVDHVWLDLGLQRKQIFGGLTNRPADADRDDYIAILSIKKDVSPGDNHSEYRKHA